MPTIWWFYTCMELKYSFSHTDCSTRLIYVPTQSGADPVHVPSSWQVLISLPEARSSSNPELQVYEAVWPVTATTPLAGSDNTGHWSVLITTIWERRRIRVSYSFPSYVLSEHMWQVSCTRSGTSDKGPLEKRDKDSLQSVSSHCIKPLRRGQPLYNGQNSWSQSVEVKYSLINPNFKIAAMIIISRNLQEKPKIEIPVDHQ